MPTSLPKSLRVAVRPSPNIGTQVLFENERVRVWELCLAPGESSELHHHSRDYLFVYVTPSKLEVAIPGQAATVHRYADGYVQYSVVGREGLTHQIRNLADEPHRQILVEFIGPSVGAQAKPPETNHREIREASQ